MGGSVAVEKGIIRKFTDALYCMLIIISVALPVYLSLVNSLKGNAEMFSDFFGLPEKLNFSNYTYLFETKHAFKYFTNSVLVTISVSIIVMIVNPFIAYKMAINWNSKRYQYIFFAVSSAMFIPSEVIIFPLIKILYFLKLMNVFGLILYYVVFMIPESIFLLVPYFRLFKKNLRDAAYLDGSSEFSFYINIFLPVCRPIITAITILSVIWTWNGFFMPLMILNKDPNTWTLPIFIYNFIGKFSNNKNYAFASAQIALFPVFIIYALFNKQILNGFSNIGRKNGSDISNAIYKDH